MDKRISKLENCLKVMKKCLKVPGVENCICFSDAFKVMNKEVNELHNAAEQLINAGAKEKILAVKKEIEEIQKIIYSKGKKECLECKPCLAALVFKTYPQNLNQLYFNNQL